MIRLIFIIVLSGMCFTTAQSQSQIREYLPVKSSELKLSGVDTVISYHAYCSGCIIEALGTDLLGCHSNIEKYLIWVKDGRNFIQKFDECYSYYPISVSTNSFIDIIKTHLEEIKEEEIKGVAFKVIIDGKESMGMATIDHTNHYNFEFYVNNQYFKKEIDDYRLNTEFYDNYFSDRKNPNFKNPTKEPNINYSYNQNTYLKKLKDIIESKIKQLNFKKQ